MRGLARFLMLFPLVTLAACAGEAQMPPDTREVSMTLSISSTAFSAGQPIPTIYTCLGKGSSPPLAWSGAPGGTKSFALIMDDPDAPMGTFVHWVIYNIPAASSSLPEAAAGIANPADGSVQGKNGAGRLGYTGPCPPSGTHRYFFKLYALDQDLKLKEGITKRQLESAMQRHIVDQAELIGLYKRG